MCALTVEDDDTPLACATGKIRLHVTADLAADALLDLAPEQSHYLAGVMRVKAGTPVLLFNGRDGEWRARVETLAKRRVVLRLEAQTRAQDTVPDLTLLFAPVKRARLDFLVQKAVELGVAHLRPVFTHRTVVSRVNSERLAANAVEAAEQCGRLTVPRLWQAERLASVLREGTAPARLLFCDEAGAGEVAVPPAMEAFAGLDEEARAAPWMVLIGPEGGFDPDERAALAALPGALRVSLGPRIMRADTAAIAALTLWQAALGDWRA